MTAGMRADMMPARTSHVGKEFIASVVIVYP